MASRTQPRGRAIGAKDDPSYPRCWWCQKVPVKNSPYVSPEVKVPGMVYRVCGPDCEERPEGVVVYAEAK